MSKLTILICFKQVLNLILSMVLECKNISEKGLPGSGKQYSEQSVENIKKPVIKHIKPVVENANPMKQADVPATAKTKPAQELKQPSGATSITPVKSKDKSVKQDNKALMEQQFKKQNVKKPVEKDETIYLKPEKKQSAINFMSTTPDSKGSRVIYSESKVQYSVFKDVKGANYPQTLELRNLTRPDQ